LLATAYAWMVQVMVDGASIARQRHCRDHMKPS